MKNKLIGLAIGLITTIGLGYYIYLKVTSPGPQSLRDLCSCLFVTEDSQEYCQNKLGIRGDSYQIKKEVSELSTSALKVKFLSKEFGCQEIDLNP